jgi:type I restriction enzyme R subunit
VPQPVPHDVILPFEEAKADPKVRAVAVVNDEDNFGLVFDNVFADKMVDH